MVYKDNETLECKYLRLRQTIGGYSTQTVDLYKDYIQIKYVDGGCELEAIEKKLFTQIEKDVEAFVFENIRLKAEKKARESAG